MGWGCRARLKSCIIQLRWLLLCDLCRPIVLKFESLNSNQEMKTYFSVNVGLKHSGVSQLYPTLIRFRVLAREGCKH